MSKSLCFVLMPFGRKLDAGGKTIDFDAVFRQVIAPAIQAAGMEAIRADEELVGGIIHKPMFERLMLCDCAVADLTTANANVFYELGVRHAVRPHATVLIFAGEVRLPFDVAPLRALPYTLDAAGQPAAAAADVDALAKRLRMCQEPTTDSPVFQLLEDYGPPDIKRLKTDLFRERATSERWREELRQARDRGVTALRTVETQLGDLAAIETGIIVDLFLSYRAVKAWEAMIALASVMPKPLARTVMIREQLALALNRAGRGVEAEASLRTLIDERGPSSETNGLLGRIYKDRWEAAAKASRTAEAEGLLRKAIEAYLKGFEADPRDAFPGINAVTLMELRNPPDPRRLKLLPVVAYAVERRIAAGKPDYWDHATRLEIAVLQRDEATAREALGDALAVLGDEAFAPETTARNLRLIREARETRGDAPAWAAEIEIELMRRHQAMTAGKT